MASAPGTSCRNDAETCLRKTQCKADAYRPRILSRHLSRPSGPASSLGLGAAAGARRDDDDEARGHTQAHLRRGLQGGQGALALVVALLGPLLQLLPARTRP